MFKKIQKKQKKKLPSCVICIYFFSVYIKFTFFWIQKLLINYIFCITIIGTLRYLFCVFIVFILFIFFSDYKFTKKIVLFCIYYICKRYIHTYKICIVWADGNIIFDKNVKVTILFFSYYLLHAFRQCVHF